MLSVPHCLSSSAGLSTCDHLVYGSVTGGGTVGRPDHFSEVLNTHHSIASVSRFVVLSTNTHPWN